MSLSFLLLHFIILLLNLFFVQRDIRHPSNIFLFSWTVVYFLLSLHLVKYVEIPLDTYLILFLTSLAFILSSHLGGYSYAGKQEISDIALPINKIVALGYIGLFSALAYYQTKYGLEQLLFNPGYVRANDEGGTGLLGLIIFMPTILFVLVAVQAFLHKRLTIPAAVYLFSVLVYMLILPERTTFINTIVWTLLAIYASNKQPQFFRGRTLLRLAPKVLMVLIISLGFFVAVSQRTGKVEYIRSIEYSLNYTDVLPLPLYDPYIYLTGSLPALGQTIDASTGADIIKVQPYRTTLFFNRGLQILGFSKDGSKLTANKEFGNIPFLFNTYTWIYDPLKDYGVVGAVIYAALCGWACGFAWSLSQKLRHALTFFLYGWGATAAIFSIMTNKFASIYFTYALILALIVLMYYLFSYSLYIKKPRRELNA